MLKFPLILHGYIQNDMKSNIKALSLILTICICLSACGYNRFESGRNARSPIERAQTLCNALCDYYLFNENGALCVARSVEKRSKKKGETASVWHVTAVIAATNYLIAYCDRENAKYFSDINKKLYNGLTYYAGTAEIVTYGGKFTQRMYAVNRASKAEQADITGINSVYDDQMWLIREFIQTYRNTGDTSYLDQAVLLTEVCLSGWDCSTDENGNEFGGIPWGAGYASKHTCSNAPLIAPLTDLYEIYRTTQPDKAEYYLDRAKKIYDFCLNTFENENGVYGDLIGTEITTNADGIKQTLSHGTLDPTAYTYNTGTVLQGAAKLYKATNDQTYLSYAQKLSDAAYNRFVLQGEENGLKQFDTSSTQWFNFQLLSGFAELFKTDSPDHIDRTRLYIQTFADSLDYAYDNFYDNGLLPRNLIGGWSDNDEDKYKDVLDSAAYVEMFALLSRIDL